MWHKNGSLIDNVYVETPLPTWPPSAKAVDSSTLPQIRASKLAVDVAPGETTDIFVVISAPHGLDEAERWLYSGYAQFSMQWEGEDTATYQNVPYGGFNADLSKNRVIAEESTGVLGFTDMDFNPVQASDVRVSASGEFVFTYGLDTASRRVNVRYIDEQGQFAGYLNSNCHTYLQRVYVSGDNIQFYTLNGEAFKTCNEDDKPFNLTAGTYHIRLEALRAFGDPDNTDDYEVWDSDKIIVE
ncbi:hypothetical protein GGF46_005474 [Coemansia sp. RSA 552]|nr:hypothetical protein GGF46_005474 [Coemansia sp. RSA 552]